ncbi:MAG: TerD family protein [Gammaproteobacteria bacterium]
MQPQRIDLVAGQNMPLSLNALHLLIEPQRLPPEACLDVSAFLLDRRGKVTCDEDFVFFNNPCRPEHGIEVDAEKRRFTLRLDAVGSNVEKIAIVATLADGVSKGQSFRMLQGLQILAKDFLTGMEIAGFALQTAQHNETALIVVEFYRYQSQWKLRAVGQGFVGGLQPLAEGYGVDVGEGESGGATSTLPNAVAEKVNLSKITLDKKGQSISLEKGAAGLGEIVVNLNWNSTPTKTLGMMQGGNAGIDLDLACLWEFRNGMKGGVQALGGHFGNLAQFPFIELDQDDRSGRSIGGETLRINGRYWQEFRRILIFTFIYEGVPNWSHVDAVVTVKAQGQPDIEVRLDSYRNDQFMCAIAMLENLAGKLSITKLVDYFGGHMEMDRAYGWGLRYTEGTK